MIYIGNVEFRTAKSAGYLGNTGWFVLFLLKKVRKGLPEVFGTPSDRPCETYEAAYAQACITVGLLLNAKRLGVRPGSNVTGKIPDVIREMILTNY
jgi:hypothetical protein